MKKSLLLLFAAFATLVASAQTKVEIDGIWYNLITKAKQAEVTYKGDSYDSYDEYSGSITLPATVTHNGVAYSVTSIENYAFYQCSSLTAITIPEGVTSIGDKAFSGCSNLTAITIPEGVTSIEWGTFSGCTSLTTITIPEGVTSIGNSAFADCTSLTDVYISSIEAWCKITFEKSDSNPLYYAHNLYLNGKLVTNLVIPEGVTSIGGSAFSSCSSLTTITLPESVTSIGWSAFSGCSSLTAITIPEKSQLTSIGDEAFASCWGLTAITLPESVTSIGNGAFYDCSSLTTITIPEGVTSIGGSAFSGCSSLTAIILPEGVTSIGWSAFSGCSSLTDVYCYAEMVPSTETNAFDGSYPEYTTLHVPTNAVASYKTTTPWSSFGTIVSLDAAITRITLSASSATLTAGESLTLTITTTPEDADRNLISWSSNNPSIATVDNMGKVTAIAPGTATITVTANDGSGVSAQYEVTVTPASYVITFLVDGEQVLVQTLTHGSAITLPDVPTKEGYTFSGWGEVPETMPAEDVTIEGTFTANKYLVTFKIGDEVIASDSLEYKSAIIAPEAPEKEGYTFSGWGEVADSVPAHDLTYEGSYSINFYTLTYMVDGEIVKSDSIAYGTAITLLKEPTKEGYTFSGWSEIPETMPAHDVTINATFIPNKYLVTFKIGDEVIASDSLEYKSAIIAPEAPEKEGYTFSGWGVVADSVPAHDLTYEGSYSINFYTLTYMVDGDVVLTLPVVYGATIPSLKAPTKEGYTFSGWSEAPATMPAKDVTIEGTFTQLPSVYLTINQADNGCVKQKLVEGTSCTFIIEPAEGWLINAVTFNGEDVTSQLGEGNVYTTPQMLEDATLNISYEKIDDSIESTRANAVKVRGHNGIISISGAAEGEAITIYTLDGTMVANTTATTEMTSIEVPTGQVYIVKAAEKVVKIGM